MPKGNNKSKKRVRNLVFICGLIAVVLSTATYAWFIGMRTVNVSSFDVEIASTDSLMLSLDGDHWASTVAISADTYNDDTEADGDAAVVYTGNTNNWAGRGLLPMSAVGDMDSTASRMKLFEKASLTATPGGYRLMASRVDNYNSGKSEQDGYVVFDLFVKNFSGTQYIENLDTLDEEAIYLTNDSEVNVATGGVVDTGIENSVRVAFAQIGRVAGTTDVPATITGIKCDPDASSPGVVKVFNGVTGICRTAQIWEPNDLQHVDDAISWYTHSCKARTGQNVTLPASYGLDPVVPCGQVIDGFAYPTYAVSEAIASSDHVDIYDGTAYNGYVAPDPDGEGPLEAPTLLESYNYFTDSEKLLTGTARPSFMTLAPNSITKVRVYIFIEGQDIDNYDFASIGKKIAVKFGFTKERYTENDINYNGPDLNQGEGPEAADKTAPIITLLGENPMHITQNSGAYVEPGATVTDNEDTLLELPNEDIVITGTVNHTVVGTYSIRYKATDTSGNVATKIRTVIVDPES